jgi:HlyD family secretion protein
MKKIENYSVISESGENSKIRILLVDDQSFVRRFISKSIKHIPNLNIVGTANNGQEAIEQVELLQPDVVLLDLEMPEMDGVTATEIIKLRFPQCKIVVLSSHEDGERLQNALRAGAKGYLLKGSPPEELINAIYLAHKGYTQLSPGLLEKVLTPKVEVLTPETETQIDNTEINDWADSTRESIETIPRVSLRGLLYLLFVLAAFIIPWVMFAKVDEIGTAKGKLEPKGKVVRLDAPVSGTVMSIDAREGATVKVGQSLLKLESQLVNSELLQQQQKLASARDRYKQLQLLKDRQLLALNAQQQQNQAQQFEKQALIDQAKQTLSSLQSSYDSQLAEKQAQIQQAKEAISGSTSEAQTAKIVWETAQEKIPRYEDAFRQGVISQDRLLEAQQTAKQAQADVNRTTSEIAQAQFRYQEQQRGYDKLRQQLSAEIGKAALQLQEQQRGYQALIQTNNLALLKSQEEFKNTDTEIANVKGEIAQTDSLIRGLNYQLQQRVIFAPIEGTVFQLPIQKPGAVVQPGQMVAQISPKNVPLILRATMSSRESGFLEVGLPVNVKFDAYPFQDYGIVPGRVSWISPDSRVPEASSDSREKSKETGEFYEIEVELSHNFIQSRDRRITLVPGQTATAEIIIRQRRLADIFLAPFKSLQKGGIQL